jgi:branched-subunit amino acid transport protein
VTWGLVLGLAAGAYLLKVLGLVVLGGRTLPPVVQRCLALIPAAMFSALVAKDALTLGQELGLDARSVGVGVAVVAAWLRAPLIVVIVAAAVATAAVRAL